jgi:predicted nucleic acid-binding protein
MAVLVDTGVLYALADADDGWHERSRRWLEDLRELVLAPVTVLPEVAYLLQTRLGSAVERRFVRSLATGELDVEPLESTDIQRAFELTRRYPDLGFVDLSMVAMAERLKVTTLATTDRRHLSRVTPKHVASFTLVP